PRYLGARDSDFRRDPILAVADDHVFSRPLAAERRHPPFDDVRDVKQPRLAVDLIGDLGLPHAEEGSDQDFQEPGRPAGAAGENPRQRLDGLDARLLIDEKARGPVAARQGTRNIDDEADIDARQVRVAGTALFDVNAGPGLTVAFGR